MVALKALVKLILYVSRVFVQGVIDVLCVNFVLSCPWCVVKVSGDWPVVVVRGCRVGA